MRKVSALVLLLMVQPAFALEDPTRPVFVGAAEAVQADVRARDYQLSSIQLRAGRRTAMINGESMQEGQVLGQATLARIGSDHVVLQIGDQQRTLFLFENSLKKVIRKAP